MIDVEDHPRYDSAGKLIMTTVSYAQVTALQALGAWFDPVTQVVGKDVLYAPDEDAPRATAVELRDGPEQDRRHIVVLEQLTDYPKEHGDGALIQAPWKCPAFNELFSGDLILGDRRCSPCGRAIRRASRSTRCRWTNPSRSPCAQPARPTTSRSPGKPVRRRPQAVLLGISTVTRSRSRWRSPAVTWAGHRPA